MTSARRAARSGRQRINLRSRISQRRIRTTRVVTATTTRHPAAFVLASDLEFGADEVARLEEPYVPHAISWHE
jgi:hypothetical protein